MKVLSNFLLLVIALVSTCSPISVAANGYDIMVLVQSWGPTYCLTVHCKSTVRVRFLTHGLWPADSKGVPLSDCPGKPITKAAFDVQIKNIEPQLQEWWPSIDGPQSGKSFWYDEWSKHGICSESKLPLLSYMNKVVAQSSKLEVAEDLWQAGIVPSNSAFYPKVDIVRAVQARIGTDNAFYISCAQDTPLLREVFFCMDQLADNFISCPSNRALEDRGCKWAPGKPNQFQILLP